MDERNDRLYFLKGIACIGVVLIHIPFPGLFGQVVLKASAFAVPVFCMISGYYAYGRNADTIKRRLKKVIRLFLIGYALFFVCYALFAAKDHRLMEWLNKNFNLFVPIKAVVFCIIDFAVPLWYLIGMTETYILWLIIIKKKREKNMLRLLPLLFSFQLVLITYCESRNLEMFLRFNFVTRVLPWFLLGYYLHTEASEKLRNIASRHLFLLIAAGCTVAVVPTLFDLPVQFNCAGYIPYAAGLFLWALRKSPQVQAGRKPVLCRIWRKSQSGVFRSVQYIGEKLSVYVYLIHITVSRVAGLLAEIMFSTDIHGNVYLWLRPVIALVMSLLCSQIIYMICRLEHGDGSSFH